MADQLNRDSDNTYQNQSLGRQQTASTHDQIGNQSPHEDVIQGTLLQKYCRICKDNSYKCKLDGYKVETLLHIPLAIRYYLKPDEHNSINSQFECNLHEYNVWQYLMNSPRQCSKLSTTFSNGNQSVSVFPQFMVAINIPVIGKEQAKEITEQVLKYVFNTLGQILDVEEVSVLDGNIEDSVQKLNVIFNTELAHASKIEQRIFIVYPHSGKECVDKCLREYKDDSRQIIVTQTFCLDRVVKRFPTEINRCLSNPSISYTVESVDNQSVYTLSGPESLVSSAIGKLSLVKENLKHNDIKHLTRRKINGLKHLNVEDGINAHLETKFPNIVFEQNKASLCVYGIESDRLSDAAIFVEQLIEDRVQQIEGKTRNQIESIKTHLQGKFEGKILVDTDEESRLYLFGLRPDVDEACSELLEIQEVRRSIGSSTHDRYDPNRDKHDESTCPRFSERYDIRQKKHVAYFQRFFEKIENNYKVNISINPEQFSLKINGSEEGVKLAVEYIHTTEQKLIFDSFVVSQNTALQFFESESSNHFLRSIGEESDVDLQKHSERVFAGGKLQVTKTEHYDHNKWTVSDGRSLFVEQCRIEEAKVSVKVIPSTSEMNAGVPIVKGQHIVDLRLPAWIDGLHYEFEDLKKELKQIFHELDRANENTVLISLKPTPEWTFDQLMNCTAEFAVEWLLTSTITKPTKVMLCPDKEEFAVTDKFVDKCVADFISATQNKDELNVTVCQGELDKTEVDVLVNTTSANLDLSKGNVSAALLKTAGPGLQKECNKKYGQGLRHREIAVTRGYGTGCRKIYHMALLPYSTKDSIKNIRIHMIGCLQLASDNGHTSIAFPAMGTGSLGYPAELVASEMFGCVERFKRDCPQTTLKMIKFVIYHKDIELFQYFKQIEMSGRSCSQVRIEMVGTEKSINMSKERLDAKVHELLKLHVTDQSNISSASYVSPKPVDENDLACGGLTPTENNFSKDNTHSSALKTPPEESKEENGRRSSKDCHRKQRMYDRTFSLTKDAEYLKVFEIDDCMLRVYKGDILNVPIDCMVIAKEGNQQHYVDNISATDVQVVGEACCLNRKKEQTGTCVIQAVFPSWFNYKPMTRSNFTKCADDLRKTTLNCLQLAENENCTCIAFSSLNSGKFDVPQEVCAVQYAEAIKMFTKERRSKNVKEIHFIDQNRNMVEIIQKTFQDVIHDGKHSPYNMNLYFERSSVDKSGGASVTDNDMKSPTRNTVLKTSIYIPSQQNLSKKDFAEYDKQVSYIQDRKTLKCFFPPGNVVEVYDADILSLSDVEAIVCSENKQGGAKGMIAQALLKVGGDPYSYAKMKEFYKYKNSGDIITTQGGKCGFQWVMHAIISRKCKQNVVPIVYRNVLLETKRKNISSLALPILGTGCEDMDVIDSARLLLSELIQFFNDSKNRQFTLHVHLVLNDKDIASSVKDVFKTHIDKTKESHKSEVEPRTGQISVDMGHKSHSYENETGDIKDDVKTKSDFSTVGSATKDEEVPQDCVICMDNITKPMKLICGHTFCSECIEGYFRVRKVCPTCGKVCGIITGDQPEGMMDIIKRREHLEGYKRYKTIAITYSFASGKQGTDHPNPGTPYTAITRTAFLPDNVEGREICALLKVAFERRLVFTIGTSRTTGKEGVITWNDIHHKTDFRSHTQFGYPDGTYLQRVREELEVKGVTMADIDKDFIRKLDKDNFRQIIK